MKDLLKKLSKIEEEYPEFFTKQGKDIPEFIANGIFKAGVFFNKDLPQEILSKIHKAFDEAAMNIGLKS